jgi:hypothetical protein
MIEKEPEEKLKKNYCKYEPCKEEYNVEDLMPKILIVFVLDTAK